MVQSIVKAESLINEKTKPIDIHFLYQSKIEISYKDRDKENGLEKVIEACNQQIAISSKTASAFKREYPSELPSHKGYEQLAIILEKQKKYVEVIQVSKKALKEAWNGTWEKRIDRCSKKLKNAYRDREQPHSYPLPHHQLHTGPYRAVRLIQSKRPDVSTPTGFAGFSENNDATSISATAALCL